MWEKPNLNTECQWAPWHLTKKIVFSLKNYYRNCKYIIGADMPVYITIYSNFTGFYGFGEDLSQL